MLFHGREIRSLCKLLNCYSQASPLVINVGEAADGTPGQKNYHGKHNHGYKSMKHGM